jgi:Helix-turn-helix of DDE superfamily endonuclease
VLFYRAALPLSSRTLNYVAGIVRRHRASIGSLWRKLNPGRQALLVLACLRKGETFAELAAGFGVGTATAWRYVNETVALLAARAPRLRKAVRDAKKAGYACVVVDGTLIPIDRVAADRPFYSGKHKRHGMNLPVIASPAGDSTHAKLPYRGKSKPASQKEANRAHAKLRPPGEREKGSVMRLLDSGRFKQSAY